MSRSEALARLRAEVRAGRLIIASGVGNGLSARCAVAGGADLLFIYNTGHFRMTGRGSYAGLLPFADANALVLEMAADVLPIVSEEVSVIGGVCGTDPYRRMPVFLRHLSDLGLTGVMNWPSVGIIDGTFRQNLEETGFGLDKEVAMIRAARELDLLAAPFAFDGETAEAMARAGADVVVTMPGVTTSGTTGATTAMTLDAAVGLVQEIADAARAVDPDVLVLCHGGPIATARDVHYVLERTTGIVGFLGGSAMERLPVETALTAAVAEFKNLAP